MVLPHHFMGPEQKQGYHSLLLKEAKSGVFSLKAYSGEYIVKHSKPSFQYGEASELYGRWIMKIWNDNGNDDNEFPHLVRRV